MIAPFDRLAGLGLRREVAAVVRLATPVVLGHLGMMALGIVDTMMLGRVSDVALAAGALGNSITFGLLVFPMGILMALDPLVAQAFGAGNHRGVARHMKHGWVLAVALAIPLALLCWDTRGTLAALGQQPEVSAPSAAYIRAIIPGMPAFLVFVALRQTLQAMSLVRPAVLAVIAANGINIVANYALIFGHFGFPALGVVGSGWATSLARWTMVLVLIAAARPTLQRYARGEGPVQMQLTKAWAMLKLGLPIGLQVSLEIWLFMAAAIAMGRFGARELAGHQIALNLAALSFMVPLGISGAATTRVGNAIGRGSMPDARRAAAVSLVLGGLVMSFAAALFRLAPEALSRIFTPDREVIAIAAVLIPIAAVFQIFDGLQVVGAGVLRGAADIRFPAAGALFGYWGLGLPLGAYLGFSAGQGPQGLWWGLTLGLAATAVLFLIRIRIRFAGDIQAVEQTD